MRKKKLLVYILTMMILIGLLPQGVFAATEESAFTFDAVTGTITGYDVTIGGTDVIIPTTIGGVAVKRIRNYAFSNKVEITSVVISNSVVYIGMQAFSNCTNLTSVIIGESVATIFESAFSGCTSLTTVTIGKSVTVMRVGVFWGCSNLKSITFNNTWANLDIFQNCDNLETITLSDSVKYVERLMMAIDSTKLYKDHPDGIVYIGDWALAYKGTMPKDSEIILKPGTKGIGESTFSGQSNMISINIPDSVKYIGKEAFCYTSLTSLTIPDSVENIGLGAFGICNNLKTVNIGNSVKYMGDYVFSTCSALESITIGNSVEFIGSYAFSGCSSLTELTIPDSVKVIGENIVSSCYALKSIDIGDSVTCIPKSNFKTNTSLTSVTIGNSVASIGDNAFENCSGLTSINIPNSVTSIGNAAFSGSGLASIVIPSSVKSIGDSAFENCSGLTSINIPDSVTTIGNSAFSGSGLTSIMLGNSVASIGDNAFTNCTGLTTITIPESVKHIGKNVMNGCSNLSSIKFAANIPPIMYMAFSYNSSEFPAVTFYVPKGAQLNYLQSFNVHNRSVLVEEDLTQALEVNVNPTTVNFDLYVPKDVTTEITWNNASAVSDIKIGGETIGASNFDVWGTTLTIKQEYLVTQSAGNLALTIEFDVGNAVVLNITVSDTTPNPIINATISPAMGTFDIDSPADVSTTVNWGDAKSITDVVYGSSHLTSPDAFTLSGETLTIMADYLNALKLLTGDQVEFEISFDVGDNAILTVEVAQHYIPSSNASLSDLTVGGSTVNGFATDQYEYDMVLPYGTLPTSTSAIVRATPTDKRAAVSITQTATLPGTAIVEITSEDGTRQTYNVYFKVGVAPTYTLTVMMGLGGSINAGSSGNYAAGTIIAITAIPISGYSFNQWKSNSGGTFTNANSASTTFTMPANAVSLLANFTYNGSSGGGGGGYSSTPTPMPTYKALVSGIDISGTNLGVAVNANAGRATVDLGSLKGYIFTGEKMATIAVPSIPGVNAYTLEISSASLSATQGEGALTFATEKGSITLPDNMLLGILGTDGKKAGITIGQGDKSSLPQELKTAIGDHPLVQLTLMLNGVQTQWNNPEAPIKVSIPYTPTVEELKDPENITIWYVDGAGNIVPVTSGKYNPITSTVTFSTTHFSNFAVVYMPKTFDDLGSVVWAKKSTEVLASKGILKGTTEKQYGPEINITRADFLYFLMRTLGVDAKFDGNFSDISSDAYYYREIGIAKKLGITSGMESNKFMPDARITRQDMMVLTERALRTLNKFEVQVEGSDLYNFTDHALVADYAVEGVASAIKEGLILGSNNQLNPLGSTTRAEAAVFLYRIYNKY